MFLLLLFLVHQWSVALFRMMGALCRNIVVANAVGLMFMLLVFLMGGFVITKQNVRPWTVWLYWSSPMQASSPSLTVTKCKIGTVSESARVSSTSLSCVETWQGETSFLFSCC